VDDNSSSKAEWEIFVHDVDYILNIIGWRNRQEEQGHVSHHVCLARQMAQKKGTNRTKCEQEQKALRQTERKTLTKRCRAADEEALAELNNVIKKKLKILRCREKYTQKKGKGTLYHQCIPFT
jgi:hypothetical protein